MPRNAHNAIQAHALARSQDQLAERDEVRKIVRQQLMEHLEGGDFWNSILSVLKPVASVARTITGFIPHPAAQAVSSGLSMLGAGPLDGKKGRGRPRKLMAPSPMAPEHAMTGAGVATKKKRKLTDRMKKRNDLVRRLMREEGMTLPDASRYIKEHNLL